MSTQKLNIKPLSNYLKYLENSLVILFTFIDFENVHFFRIKLLRKKFHLKIKI